MSQKTSSFRSDLGRVKGLGSAKEGTAHWWGLRITSLALVPLSLWFMIGLTSLVGADQTTVQAWVKSPFNAIGTLLFLGFMLHHSANGIQTVVEDYLHNPWVKTAVLILNKLAHVAAAAAAAYAVIIIAVKV